MAGLQRLSIAGLALLTIGATAPTRVTLPGARVFPESVTSTRDGTLYAGSVGQGGIYRTRPGATEATVWIAPGAGGSGSIFGILADERAGMLWACSNARLGLDPAVAGVDAGAALKGFDLRTGRLRVSVPLPGDKPVCNDMAAGPDGALYVTDTAASRILRLAPRAHALERWFDDPTPPAKGGLDGIVFDRAGALYVNAFGDGRLFRIMPRGKAPGEVTKLTPSRPLEVPDAMRLATDGSILLVEGAGRLARITPRGDMVSVETLRSGLDGASGVTVVGSAAWVSQGQLGALFGGKPPQVPFALTRIDLAQ